TVSLIRTRGNSQSVSAQKICMPARHKAIMVHNPAAMVSENRMMAPVPPSSMGASNANLARKPGRGGNPANNSAQAKKQIARTAIGAGVDVMRSSSSENNSSPAGL